MNLYGKSISTLVTLRLVISTFRSYSRFLINENEDSNNDNDIFALHFRKSNVRLMSYLIVSRMSARYCMKHYRLNVEVNTSLHCYVRYRLRQHSGALRLYLTIRVSITNTEVEEERHIESSEPVCTFCYIYLDYFIYF